MSLLTKMSLRDLSNENNEDLSGKINDTNVVAITTVSAGLPKELIVEEGETPVLFSDEVSGAAPKIEGSLIMLNDNVAKVANIKDLETAMLGDNGASKDVVVAIESLMPGLVTSKYPLGYFTTKPSKVHFEALKNILSKKIVSMEEEAIAAIKKITLGEMAELLTFANYHVEKFIYTNKDLLLKDALYVNGSNTKNNILNKLEKCGTVIELNGEFIKYFELSGMGSAVGFNGGDWDKLYKFLSNRNTNTYTVEETPNDLAKGELVFVITKLKQILDIPEVAKFYTDVLNHRTFGAGTPEAINGEIASNIVLANTTIRGFIELTMTAAFLENVERYLTSFKEARLNDNVRDLSHINVSDAADVSTLYAKTVEQIKIIDVGLNALMVIEQNVVPRMIELVC